MYVTAPCPYWPGLPTFPGLGDDTSAASDAQLAQVIGSGSSLAATTALGVTAASSGGLILGMSAATAIPIIGAALAGITMLAGYLIKNSGCGQTCIETSQWANQAEALLKTNIAAYFALPAPRSQTAQSAALANFDQVWAALTSSNNCGNPSTGNAGKNCIANRQAGACQWKQTTTSPLLAYPGEPQPGACWNWFNGYRDPIANDPDVVADSEAESAATSVASATGITSALQSAGISTSYAVPVLIGAALLIAWMAFK